MSFGGRRAEENLAGRLRVQEFMVITDGGVPIFHYSPSDTRKLDELLSGFLTAITSFASEFGEKSVQSLSFEGSEILYEQEPGKAIFIFLVDVGAQESILRIVLSDLSSRFLEKHESDLLADVQIEERFEEFRSEVREAFEYYEGVLMVTSRLSAYVVPRKNKLALALATDKAGFLDEFHREFGYDGTRVLEAIDGKASIERLAAAFNIEDSEISEIIEYLAIWGVIGVSQLCPKIRADDARFDAFLDIVGLPNKDYQLLQRAKAFCTGTRSVVDASIRLNVTAERLYEVLLKMGDEVEWNLVEVAGLPDTLQRRLIR
ncbi:MAG: hypothetical protein JSW61_07775 [Candidatus Thorarchaeota archaeon]|nr:MAG: hypothetical protein JSW61_07775 [Candidatus Thorarchaeota archaeon]